MVTKTPEAVLKKIEKIVHESLDDLFGADFTFAPVMVISRQDHWDQDRVYIYVVYDGKPNSLGSERTLQLVDAVMRQTTEEELPIVPFNSFIHKSEWPEFYKHNVVRWIPETF